MKGERPAFGVMLVSLAAIWLVVGVVVVVVLALV